MRHHLLPIALVAALLGAACGSDTIETTATGRPSSATPIPAPTPESRGWIGGEPDWFVAGEDGADSLLAAGEDADALEESGGSARAATEPGTDRESLTVDPGDDGAEPPVEPPSGPLTGGSIDDNADFEDYLRYRERVLDLGIPLRDLDPAGRVVVHVSGANGLPLAGVEVSFGSADGVTTLRTTADGSVRFHPRAHGAGDGPFTVTAAGTSVEAAAGQDDVVIEVPVDGGVAGSVPLDIVFLLDATGSMADEIDQLKATIDSVASRIDELPGAPDVRIGMTLYRDEGDSFLNRTFDLTADIEAFAEALAAVVADGGGDYPEALDEALAAALAEPSWRAPADAVQLVFLVADAPPQVGRDVQTPYTASMLDAARRGIKILPVSSSGTDDQAELVFRQLAQFTGGRYVFLTYGAGGRATGPSTDITAVDYEELALDDLIVRLVAEELAELTGDPDVVPPPQPTPTPDGGQDGN